MANGALLQLGTEEWSVIYCIMYYDVFEHPLRASEIWEYSKFKDRSAFDEYISQLIQDNIIYKCRGYYRLRTQNQLLRTKSSKPREKGQQIFKQKLPRAIRKARLIWKFPFIRGVYFSGSMSKENMGMDDDIDFFLVTAPNRLWLCKALLIAYKKIILGNSRRYFCVNYMVDTEQLEIDEQNPYSAMELITLQPAITNSYSHGAFLSANQWYKRFFPNARFKRNLLNPGPFPSAKLYVEIWLSGSLGHMLEHLSFRVFKMFTKLKYHRMMPSEFNHSFVMTAHVSRHHPRNFKDKILDELNIRMKALDRKLRLDDTLVKREI